jgi:hypothetical protein
MYCGRHCGRQRGNLRIYGIGDIYCPPVTLIIIRPRGVIPGKSW